MKRRVCVLAMLSLLAVRVVRVSAQEADPSLIAAQENQLSEARSLAALGSWSDAEKVVRGFLETHSASPDGHYLLGYLLFKRKNAKASLAEYTEGAKYRTPSAADFEAIAGDYVLLHDYPDAAKWFAKAVELDPGNFRVHYFLARALYNENRFEDAVRAFEECLKLDPASVKATDNLGLSYEGLGRMEEAEAAYRLAISRQEGVGDKDPGPYVNLGALLITTGKPEEAVPLLQTAVRLDEKLLAAHRELGKAYSYLGQLEKAQQELERTVELSPDTAVPHYLLAQVYRKRGLLDKAQAETDRYRALVAAHSTDADSTGGQVQSQP